MEDFLAGGLASIVAISICHPIDVVKSRLQMNAEGASKSGSKYGGVVTSLIKIGRYEGLSGLYRGLIPAYFLQFSVTATRFGVYSVSKTLMASYDENLGEKPVKGAAYRNFLLAGVSGFFGGIFGTPWFALKTQQQVFSTSKELAVGTQHNESFSEALVTMWKNGGFTRGATAFIPRVVFFGTFQLGSYDMCKEFFASRFQLEGIKLHFGSAFVAAVTAVCAIQPFDFIAARFMNQPVDPVTKKGLYYSGMIDCVVKSIRLEGPTCLLKGMTANAARMGPYSILVLVFFEQFKPLVVRSSKNNT